MEETEYIAFFEKIEKFLEEQQKQKQRGLNDYNILNVVRSETAEVGMHSNVIYSLINPDGLHYQDDLFLNIFIKNVLGFKIEDFGDIVSVNAEEATDQNRRIDFTIKSTNYYIGIEMKINAGDLNNQISHYKSDLEQKSKNDNNQEVIIYYLTKNGKDAASHSHNGVEYKNISFEKHILNWIVACQKEVRNITNLNEAFENYKNVVQKIINKYKGNVMPIKNLLLKDENLKLAINLQKHIKEIKFEIQKSFWLELQEMLNSYGYSFKFVTYDFKPINNIGDKVYRYYYNRKNNRNFGLKFDLLTIDNEYTLSYYIELDSDILYGFTISKNGIRKNYCKIESFLKLKETILNISTNQWIKKSEWWLAYKYPEKRLNFRSFNNQNIFDLVDQEQRKIDIEKIVKEIDQMIKDFKTREIE